MGSVNETINAINRVPLSGVLKMQITVVFELEHQQIPRLYIVNELTDQVYFVLISRVYVAALHVAIVRVRISENRKKIFKLGIYNVYIN